MAEVWPIDYEAESIRRTEAWRDLDDALAQELSWEFYRERPHEWIMDFCVTFNPRNKHPLPRLMPFVPFARQVALITFLLSCLNDGEGGLVEKSRDMGASWICCAFSVWLWLYHDGSTIGFGSRKKEYVDRRGDPKSIFHKIRQIVENLPSWMLPEGFNPKFHATDMKLINPANESTITGEVGDNIGRGGRTTIYFKDESAHYERPELVEAALGDNTDVQIDISSVNGPGNVFYRRRMAGDLWTPEGTCRPGYTRVFIMDWRDHPGKDQAWYDMRRARMEREGLLHIFAQEVDRDYSASLAGIIINAEWVRACIDAHKKLGFTASGERVAAQDVADGGGDKNALAARHGVILQHASNWGGEAGEAPRIAVPLCAELGVNELMYDSIGVGSAFKTGINGMRKAGSLPATLKVVPWNAAAPVLYPEKHLIPGDKETPKNEDFFENLKAQAWWSLRTRCYKTFRAVTMGEVYDSGELISLPSELPHLHELTMELSQAVRTYSKKGKVMVDKTPDGARSPNIADAVVMCYYPVRKSVGFFSS